MAYVTTPHTVKSLSWADLDRFVALVRGHEDDLALSHPQAFEGEFPVEETYGDTAVVGLQRLVHDQQVAVGDAVVLHAVARDPSEECRTRIADQLPVQVEGRVEVVVGRRGKTRRDAARRHGKFRAGRGVGADEPEPYFFLVVHLVIHSRCKIAKNFV